MNNLSNGKRKSIRLKGYDYTAAGYYFVTICVHQWRWLFGDIVNGKMVLNGTGKIVADTWTWLGEQYNYVELDQWVIMPNHMHGILIITAEGRGGSPGDSSKGGSRTAPTKPKPLGRLVGAFKTVSTKNINILRKTPGEKIWQRNFYERINRNEKELHNIRQYIIYNPIKWEFDQEKPLNLDL